MNRSSKFSDYLIYEIARNVSFQANNTKYKINYINH